MKKRKDPTMIGQREFIQRLAKYSGYPQEALLDVLQSMEYVLADCLDDGYKVKLWSGFVMSVDETEGQRFNFDTKVMEPTVYKKLNLKLSQGFKERFVNGGMVDRD